MVLFSIIIKGLSSVLDLSSRAIITKYCSLEEFGSFTLYISVVEMLFFVFYSGITKLNIYYGAQNVNLMSFKKEYYCYYAIPLMILLSGGFYYIFGWIGFTLGLLAMLYITYMDISSWLLANKYYFASQFGEYFLGRMCFFTLLLFIIASDYSLDVTNLLYIQVIQYIVVFVFLGLFCIKSLPLIRDKLVDSEVSIIKLIDFQQSDFFHGIISYIPIIIQYAALGAYDAGLLAVYMTFSRVITFLSGPTAKVFLPRFSEYYSLGNIKSIINDYNIIVKLQFTYLLIIATFCVFNIDFILGYFGDFTGHIPLLRCLCLVAILCTSFGPLNGLLQMIGCEKEEKRIKLSSLLAFIIIILLYHKHEEFIFWGIIGQLIVEISLLIYLTVMNLRRLPFDIKVYLCFIIGLVILLTESICLNKCFQSQAILMVVELISILIVTIYSFKDIIIRYLVKLK